MRASGYGAHGVNEHVGGIAAYRPRLKYLVARPHMPVGPGHRLFRLKFRDRVDFLIDADREYLETICRQLGTQFPQVRQRLDAGAAPGRPEIDQNRLVLEMLKNLRRRHRAAWR